MQFKWSKDHYINMYAVEIFVIRVSNIPSNKETEINKSKIDSSSAKNALKLIMNSIFGIVGLCVLFAMPWTMIKRTNSILHQSYWMEVTLPVISVYVLASLSVLLDLTIWTKENILKSLGIYWRVYLMNVVTFIVLYIFSYFIWCIFLQFNHPLPYLGLIVLPTSTIVTIGFWFIMPKQLLGKKDFRQKLQIYMIYVVWLQITIITREILSFLYTNILAEFQFLVPFLLAGCRQFDKSVRMKLLNKMMTKMFEQATALLTTQVNSSYAFFIAIRLVKAEWATMISTVAIELILHLRMTLQIIQDRRKINEEATPNENTQDNMKMTQLILTELIEGFTPIIYGTCMTMAYYGPNAHILANVGNTYWSTKIEDIDPILGTMAILFAFDTLNVLINSFCLWKVVQVNMIQEFSRVFTSYWHFLAIALGLNMTGYFASTDINLGVDGTQSFKWISRKGWMHLFFNSNNLTKE